MSRFTLIAAGLTVAGSVLTYAAAQTPGTGQAEKAPKVAGDAKKTEKAEKTITIRVDDEGGPDVRKEIEVLASDDQDLPRRLMFLSGRGVEIGVSIGDLEGDQAKTATGAVVREVRKDSPAERAGFKAGDVVVEFDGERVRSARHLARLVGETADGRQVKAAVTREGKRVDLTVMPTSGAMARREDVFDVRVPGPAMREFRFEGHPRAETLPKIAPGAPGPFEFEWFAQGRPRLGVGVSDLSPQLAEYFGTKDGVLVTSVEADSAAAKAGLKAGDVITAVNGTAVTSPSELQGEVRKADDGADVTVAYTRDKKPGTVTAKLPDRQRPRRPAQPI